MITPMLRRRSLAVAVPDDACSLFTRDPFPSGPSDLAFGRGQGGVPRTA